jgi:hypothetical protein
VCRHGGVHWKYAVALVVAGLAADVHVSLLLKGGGGGLAMMQGRGTAGVDTRGRDVLERLRTSAGLKYSAEAYPLIESKRMPQYAGTGITPLQLRQWNKVHVLAESRDWRGVVAMEGQVRAVADAVRTTDPSMAAFGYSILGTAYRNLGDLGWDEDIGWNEDAHYNFAKAVEYYKEQLAIAKEMGDRGEESAAYNNLGETIFYKLRETLSLSQSFELLSSLAAAEEEEEEEEKEEEEPRKRRWLRRRR